MPSVCDVKVARLWYLAMADALNFRHWSTSPERCEACADACRRVDAASIALDLSVAEASRARIVASVAYA